MYSRISIFIPFNLFSFVYLLFVHLTCFIHAMHLEYILLNAGFFYKAYLYSQKQQIYICYYKHVTWGYQNHSVCPSLFFQSSEI